MKFIDIVLLAQMFFDEWDKFHGQLALLNGLWFHTQHFDQTHKKDRLHENLSLNCLDIPWR
jgi:hypothetical protein